MKGAELVRTLRTVIANELGSAARLGINPKEGVLGRVYGGLKQAAILRVLARRRSLWASPQGAARGVRVNAEVGAPAQAPSCDRGRQRSRRPRVRLSQPMGAEGQQPMLCGARAPSSMLRRTMRAEAVTAKNCGIGKRSRQRELPDPPSEAGYERRCRIAPQA